MNTEELRKVVAQDNVCIGTATTLKNMRAGKLEKVLVTKNCADDVREDIKSLSEGVEVIELEQNNEELGIICKKPFLISVMGVLKT
jgi:ribosomal protein L30E